MDKEAFYPNFHLTGISHDDADRIVAAVRANDCLWSALIELQKMQDGDDEGVWLGLYKSFMSEKFPEYAKWASRLQPLIAYTLWSEKDLNRDRFSPEAYEKMYAKSDKPPTVQMQFGKSK